MTDSEKALEAVKKKFNILPPITPDDVESKLSEIDERVRRNAPAKAKMSEQEAQDRFYSRGNKRD